jgi:hypothetical protein
MQPQLVFGISVLLGLVMWGIIGARDIWPALRERPRAEALRPLLLVPLLLMTHVLVLHPAEARCGGRSARRRPWQ